MLHFIQEAGWGIYPVLVFGIAALIVAAKQVNAHDARRTTTAVWLMAMTGIAGLLGTATGVQMSAHHIHEIEEKWIFLLGLQESLNNFVAAGVLIMLAMLVMLYAHIRGDGTRAQEANGHPSAAS